MSVGVAIASGNRGGRAEYPRRPVAAFRIGVVGHTSIPGAHAKAVADQTLRLLGDLVRTAGEVLAGARELYDGAPPQLRLLSCLAPGFDQVAAEAWRQLGLDPSKLAVDG